jgi:hypothetical protein
VVEVLFTEEFGISTSKHPQMRELRIQHQGRPCRVLYAFNPKPRRHWYDVFVPVADHLYDEDLADREEENAGQSKKLFANSKRRCPRRLAREARQERET